VAAAFGVAHLGDRAESASPARFAHTHGGTTHAHDDATGTLLVAAQQTDEASDVAQQPTVNLSSHVPAGPEAVVFASTVVPLPSVGYLGAVPPLADPPIPPPPRA
jgi:hypothetical protein